MKITNRETLELTKNEYNTIAEAKRILVGASERTEYGKSLNTILRSAVDALVTLTLNYIATEDDGGAL